MRPTRKTITDSTVAKTGRWMQISGSLIAPPASGIALAGRLRVGLAHRLRRLRRVGHLHRRAVAKLHDAGCHDRVGGGEPAEDLDPAVPALPDLDLLAHRAALDHLVHVLVVADGE